MGSHGCAGLTIALLVAAGAAHAQSDALRKQADQSLRAFSVWAEGEASGRFDAAAVAEGLRLAQGRRDAMKFLIAEDPAAAIAAAFPNALRVGLPAEIAVLLQERIDGEGLLTELVTMYHDHPPGHAHHEGDFHRSVRTPVVVIGERRFFSFSHGRRLGVRSLRPVPVHGIAIDGDLALSELPYRVVADGETVSGARPASPRTCGSASRQPVEQRLVVTGTQLQVVCDPDELEATSHHWGLIERDGTDGRFIAPKAETHSSYTTGPKTFLYIRARFADQAESALPSLATVTNTVTSMRDHMRAFSYNLLPDITGTFTDVVTLPRTAAEYGSNDIPILSDAANAALAANPAWNRANYSF